MSSSRDRAAARLVQIDELEAEIETLEASKAKKDRDTVTAWETIIRNHRFHIDKLEAVSPQPIRVAWAHFAGHQRGREPRAGCDSL